MLRNTRRLALPSMLAASAILLSACSGGGNPDKIELDPENPEKFATEFIPALTNMESEDEMREFAMRFVPDYYELPDLIGSDSFQNLWGDGINIVGAQCEVEVKETQQENHGTYTKVILTTNCANNSDIKESSVSFYNDSGLLNLVDFW